jgi:exosortase
LVPSRHRANEPELPIAAGGGGLGGRQIAWTMGAFLVAVVWSYWPVLADMARKWATDPQYSHAYLVPAFAGYLLWHRREMVDVDGWSASWWGSAVLSAGVLMRLGGAFAFFDWLEAISLLFVLAGGLTMIAGGKAMRWAWPAVAFLAFMVPLPFRVETALSQPLQSLATTASTYVLQTLGQPAFAEGHIIVVNDARIGVVEACNGLGMLILFFALATAVAILTPGRHPLERAAVVLTAAPVAVAANVARITATAFAHEYLGPVWADRLFHDLAGWLMMPFALGLLFLELYLLSHLFVVRDPAAAQRTPASAARVPGPVPVRIPSP